VGEKKVRDRKERPRGEWDKDPLRMGGEQSRKKHENKCAGEMEKRQQVINQEKTVDYSNLSRGRLRVFIRKREKTEGAHGNILIGEGRAGLH